MNNLETMRRLAQASGLACREADMALWETDEEQRAREGKDQC